MTMVPAWKICLKCRKRYAWNPDAGKMQCPRCSRRLADLNRIGGIFGKRK